MPDQTYYAAGRPAGRYHRAGDETVLLQIHAVTKSRTTYGYRRVWVMVNRTFQTGYHRKRIRRVIVSPADLQDVARRLADGYKG